MIKVSVFYPNEPGKRFDMVYYLNKHIPLCREKFGCKRAAVDQGMAGLAPGSPAPFVAIAHLYFDSLDAVQGAMAQANAVMADIPNYTDIQPTIQISEVKIEE